MAVGRVEIWLLEEELFDFLMGSGWLATQSNSMQEVLKLLN